MKFNPSDKSNSIIADIDFLLFSDGSELNTEYSLVDRTRNINIAYDEAITELFRADPNYTWDDTNNTDLPCATTALVSNQDHYPIKDSALIIHQVRIKNKSGKYKTLEPKLRREFTDSQMRSTGEPDSYYKMGGAIFPVPIPDYGASAGVEIEFQRGAEYFSTSDTDKSPGFNPQFHQFLSVSAALRYAISNDMTTKVSQLRADKQQIKDNIREHYRRRSPDERPRISLKKRSIKNYGLS